MTNIIDKQVRMAESERYLPQQCADFHERFVGSSDVRLIDERLVDMVYGIDGKADLINGETVNIQFKHRFTDTHIYIPVQYVMDNMINEDACIFRNDPKNFTVKFIPSLNRADYYTFNLKDGPTVIINVRDLHRAFLRHKTFTIEEGCIFGDPKKEVHFNYKCLYVPKSLFVSIMLTDWLYTTFGEKIISSIKDGTIHLNDFIL